MNKTEVAQLLTLASAVDNRTVTPATVNVWHPIVGHLSLDVAVEAMYLHFGSSEAYLMPVHIKQQAGRVLETREREARRVRALLPVEVRVSHFDRVKFDAETQAAIDERKAAKK